MNNNVNRNILLGVLGLVVVLGIGYAATMANRGTVIPSAENTETSSVVSEPGSVTSPLPTTTTTVTTTTTTKPAPNPSPCYIGGCSGQICSDEQGVASTCEFREEYACYKTAKCERQSSGQCGWTDTPTLRTCLANSVNASVQ